MADKELNPSPKIPEGKQDVQTVEQVLGVSYGELSPNPKLSQQYEDGEHGIGQPTNPNNEPKESIVPRFNKREIEKVAADVVAKEGQKLYRHSIGYNLEDRPFPSHGFVIVTNFKDALTPSTLKAKLDEGRSVASIYEFGYNYFFGGKLRTAGNYVYYEYYEYDDGTIIYHQDAINESVFFVDTVTEL